MKKVLAILPHSIGGRLTTSSIIDGFRQNDFEVVIFDELKNENFSAFLNKEFNFIVGYDFSPVKLKIDYNIKTPCIAYFSDVIQEKTSGVGYREYFKYLRNPDIFVFYWDSQLTPDTLRNSPSFSTCQFCPVPSPHVFEGLICPYARTRLL